jgi:O-acetyl-ADP-ribose deacetylase (regulator of RNase III)
MPLKNRIHIVQGDITLERSDAIVNAANSTLLGGGGVDGAIHRAAGPELLAECRTLGGCEPGQAKITKGYRLPARWVIHTVGPVWHGGGRGEAETLAHCYRRCLELARDAECHIVSFPAVSCGAYGFPRDLAALVSCAVVEEFLHGSTRPHEVRWVFRDPDAHAAWLRIAAVRAWTA